MLKVVTWYSHWPGMTSPLTPEILMPAYRHILRCVSATSRPIDVPEPAAQ